MLRRAVAAFLACLCASAAWAIMTEVRNDAVIGPGQDETWPAGLAELANGPMRVYGEWVNGSYTLYYRAGTAEDRYDSSMADEFKEFVRKYAAIEGITHEMVLHVGPKIADKAFRQDVAHIRADWSLYIGSGFDRKPAGPMATGVDVWLGHNIGIDGLDIPKNVKVTSAGGVERFLEERAMQGQDRKP